MGSKIKGARQNDAERNTNGCNGCRCRQRHRRYRPKRSADAPKDLRDLRALLKGDGQRAHARRQGREDVVELGLQLRHLRRGGSDFLPLLFDRLTECAGVCIGCYIFTTNTLKHARIFGLRQDAFAKEVAGAALLLCGLVAFSILTLQPLSRTGELLLITVRLLGGGAGLFKRRRCFSGSRFDLLERVLACAPSLNQFRLERAALDLEANRDVTTGQVQPPSFSSCLRHSALVMRRMRPRMRPASAAGRNSASAIRLCPSAPDISKTAMKSSATGPAGPMRNCPAQRSRTSQTSHPSTVAGSSRR